MLLLDGPLTLREFMTHEEVPLASVFREVLTFLSNRTDAVVFGAQAVNAWCDVTRMTEDVDVLSTDAQGLAEALRGHLARTFHMAVRVREVVPGGLRVYQVRSPKNRHLVDVRQVAALPAHRRMSGVSVLEPLELIVMKVQAIVAREGREKGLTDRLDMHRLLNGFPELRLAEGPVTARLRELGAEAKVIERWKELVDERLEADEDDF